MTHKLYQVTIVVLFVSGLLAACNSVATPQKPDEVTIQLSWFHTVEFIGFYAAEQQGYYADENLKATLLPGAPDVDPVTEVLEGRAQFGLAAGDAIIRGRAEGQDLVAVASVFRQSPLSIMTLANSGIQRPHDLASKTVGVISPDLDTTWDIQFLAMLDELDVDRSGMNFVAIEDYHGANELVSGRMDAVSGLFSTNEAVQARLDGYEVNEMFLGDYGILMYVNPIFTTGQLIREQPDLVERFVRATLKGYQYAVEHPDEMADLTAEYDDTLDMVQQRESMNSEVPLIDTGDAPIGTMDEAVWQSTQKTLLEQGLISTEVDLNKVYTNEFVEKAQQ